MRSGIVTKVGSDAPANLTQPLRDAGVDLSGIDDRSPVTTTNELVYAADGTKELKYLKQAEPISAGDILNRYSQASAFYVCPLDYEVPLETVSQIARLRKLMAVDLGGYGGAHARRDTAEQKKMSSAALHELISSFHIVKASDEDAHLIFGGERRLSDEESAWRLLQAGAKIGIITRGPKGSLVFTNEKKYVLPALPGSVIDVTGGGDWPACFRRASPGIGRDPAREPVTAPDPESRQRGRAAPEPGAGRRTLDERPVAFCPFHAPHGPRPAREFPPASGLRSYEDRFRPLAVTENSARLQQTPKWDSNSLSSRGAFRSSAFCSSA